MIEKPLLLNLNLKQFSRVAIVGIGNEIRGDDAAGLVAVRSLTDNPNRLIIEAGSVPENFGGQLRRFGADLIVMIDSVQMDKEAGSVEVIDFETVTGLSASTHTLPLNVLAKLWQQECGCPVMLVGIQPKQNEIDMALSMEVRQAVKVLCRDINADCASTETDVHWR